MHFPQPRGEPICQQLRPLRIIVSDHHQPGRQVGYVAMREGMCEGDRQHAAHPLDAAHLGHEITHRAGRGWQMGVDAAAPCGRCRHNRTRCTLLGQREDLMRPFADIGMRIFLIGNDDIGR